MLKKQITSLIAIMMAIAVMIVFAPQITEPVYAEETENYGLVNGIQPKENGAVIWLGDTWMTKNNWNNGNRERRWRIIGENDSNWLLISDTLICNDSYTNNGAIKWQDAVNLCGTLYNHFSAVEQAAIPITVKNEPTGHYYQNIGNPGTYYDFAPQSVDANLFLLSVEEAETYLATRTPGPWWLRSPVHFTDTGNINARLRGNVKSDGTFYYSDIDNTQNCSWTRPAFQIDRSQVLFVSDAENGKPSNVGADALAAFQEASANNEWKLTLKDPERNFDVTKIKPSGNGFTVTYTGAVPGENEYISAIVKNENGDITKYGRIANVSDASGEFTITTAGKLEDGEHLYVFNEQYNGDKKSDSGSELKEIVTPQSIMVEVGSDHGTAAADLKEALDEYLTDETLPVLPEISIVGSTIHIDFPLFVDITNGDIVNLLQDGLRENIVDYYYGEDHNRKEIGYQSSYESGSDYIDDLTGKENLVLENGQIFYLLWDKPVKTVNVTVNDTPKCGFTVTGDSAASQKPKPDYVIEEEGIDPDGHACYWWSSSSAEAGEGTYYAGTATGGDKMNVFVSLQAKYGYYFVDQSKITCTLNHSPAEDVRGDDGALMFTGTIPVEHDWDTTYYVVKDPTCTEPGYRYHVCKQNTTHTEFEIMPASGHHNLTKKDAVSATCVTFGSIEFYTCDNCGKIFRDREATKEITEAETVDPIDPTKHEWDETEHIVEDPTCTEPGYMFKVCKHSATHTLFYTIPAIGHEWSEWSVTKQPTETAEGTKSRECKRCHEKETESIPARGIKPGQDPNQKGEDGTAVGPGASVAAADKAITSMKTDTDPKGSVYSKLRLKSPKQTKKSIKLSWTKVSKAKKYVIYGNKCGKTSNHVKLATVTGKTRTIKTVKGKKIKKGTYYKFIVVALDKNNSVVSTSKLIHVATKGGKVGNHKSVTVKKAVIAKAKKLKKGKSLRLNAKAVPKSKKLKVKIHVKVRYESTHKRIATVTKKGVIKAKKKGTCYVYAYAQNGVFTKIKVVVS